MRRTLLSFLRKQTTPWPTHLTFYWIALIGLGSCTPCYLSLKQIPLEKNFLASSYAQTPDPRQNCTYLGQSIVLQWIISQEILKKQPEILLDVVYLDYTLETHRYPIYSRWGYEVYSLINQDYQSKKGILTYQAQLITSDGNIHYHWKHQLWVKPIRLDKPIDSEAP